MQIKIKNRLQGVSYDQEDIDLVRDCFNKSKGFWPKIAEETDINLQWIYWLMGKAVKNDSDPGNKRITELANYFREHIEADEKTAA